MSRFATDAWRRVLVAAAVSTGIHAGVLVLIRGGAENAPEDLPPLEVRVIAVTPPPVSPAVSPPVKKASAPRTRTVEHRVPVVAPPPAGPESASEEEASAEEIAVSETPPAEEPVVVATAPSTTFSPEPAPLPAFPRSGRITYDLVYGQQQLPVGRTVQTWKIDGMRYQLASRSETTGLVHLFRAQHRTYLSRGELRPEGFRPEVFLMSRDRGRGLEEARAQFHWERASVALGAGGSGREEPVPAGSQDLLSFIYQLSIAPPPPGRREVSITNGRHLERYAIEVLAEEKIETPLGVMRALPVTQIRRPGTESVDVWLAVEYRHLPIRMRFYNRHGEPAGEQLVTEIRLADE
jgi:hypothetical protein